MRETESVKGSSYALTVAMSGETIIDFAQELRDAKTALARWHKTRKEKCGSVLLSIVAPVANHPEIELILQRIYQDADEPGPLLRTVRTEVAPHNDREKSVNQFVLGSGKSVTVTSKAGKAAPKPGPAAKTPVAPAAPPAAPAKPIDDDEDGGSGGYGLAAAPEIAPMPDVLKTKAKKDKAPARHRKLKKKQVQFGEEWQDVRLPFMLFVVGLGMWILVWIIQAVILVLAFIAENNYGVLADPSRNARSPRKVCHTAAEYASVDRGSFAIAVLVGANQKRLGKGLYITCELLDLCRHIVWIVAYVLCLKLPAVFNSRGQI